MCLEWEPRHSQHALCCYLLSPSFCFSCELSIADFFWIAFIYLSHTNPGVLLPSLWFMQVQAGCLCTEGNWLPKALGTSWPDLLKDDNLMCIRILAWSPSLECQVCYRQPSQQSEHQGLGFFRQVLPSIRAGIPLPISIEPSPNSTICCADAVLRCLNAKGHVTSLNWQCCWSQWSFSSVQCLSGMDTGLLCSPWPIDVNPPWPWHSCHGQWCQVVSSILLFAAVN